jgi:serine/threonine-protein kinase
MSPEQFMGQVVDARTDLYSSGVLLYQLLTGERPFEGGMSAIMHKALNTDPPLPSQIAVTCPAAFDGVVRKAMAKRPEERFPTAAAFLEALQGAAQGRPLAGSTADEADEAEATMLATSAPRPAAPVMPAAPAPAAPATARPVTAPAAAAPKRSALPMIAAIAAVVIVLLGGGVRFLLLRGPARAPAAHTAQNIMPTTPAEPATSTAQASAAGSSAVPPAPPPTQTANPAPAGASASPPTPTPAPALASVKTAQTPPPPQPVAPAADIRPPAPNAQVAGAGLDTMRQQVAQLAAGQNCALVNGGVGDTGNVTLDGLAGPSAADALRRALVGVTIPGAVDWRINSVDPIFCPALDTLRPIVPAFDATGPRLGLTLADGRTRLRDSEHILPRLVMPDFRGALRVDYVAHDGTLLHLYPQVADPKQHLTADPPRMFQPGEAVRLGDPSPGHRPWEVAPPYGTDMIIAIASSQPLFDRPRPDNVESATEYLRELQAAVEAAQSRGVRLAGSALTVDTVAK